VDKTATLSAVQPHVTATHSNPTAVTPHTPKPKSLFEKFFGPKEKTTDKASKDDAVEVDLQDLNNKKEQAADPTTEVQTPEVAQSEVSSRELPVNLKELGTNSAPSAPQYAQRSDERNDIQEMKDLHKKGPLKAKSSGRLIKVGNVFVQAQAPTASETASEWNQEPEQTIADDEEQSNLKTDTIGHDYPEKRIRTRKYRVRSIEKSGKKPKKIYARNSNSRSRAIVPVQVVRNNHLDAAQVEAQKEEAAALAASNLDESEINDIVGNSTVPQDQVIERSSDSRGGKFVTRVSNVDRSAEGEDHGQSGPVLKKKSKNKNRQLVNHKSGKRIKNNKKNKYGRRDVVTANRVTGQKHKTIVRSDIRGQKSLLTVEQQPPKDPFDQLENLSELPENSPLWNTKMVKNTSLPETKVNTSGMEPLSSNSPSLEERYRKIAPQAALPALYEKGPGWTIDPAELDSNAYSVTNVLAYNRYCNQASKCVAFTFYGTEPDAFWQHLDPAGENANVIWDLKAEGKAIATLTANAPVSTISTITVEPETCDVEQVKDVKLVLTQTNVANKWVISFDRGLAPEIRECVQKNIDGVTLLLGFDNKKSKQVENGLLGKI
jgi:hypothetical protein